MSDITEFVHELAREVRWLWVVAKGYVITNLIFVAGFAAFDHGSRIYQHIRHPASSLDEMLLTVLAFVLLFLWTDLILYDKTKHGRRHWRFEGVVPFIYMLLGALYLVLAFVASTTGMDSILLVIAYVANAGLVGIAAFAARLRMSWHTGSQK